MTQHTRGHDTVPVVHVACATRCQRTWCWVRGRQTGAARALSRGTPTTAGLEPRPRLTPHGRQTLASRLPSRAGERRIERGIPRVRHRVHRCTCTCTPLPHHFQVFGPRIPVRGACRNATWCPIEFARVLSPSVSRPSASNSWPTPAPTLVPCVEASAPHRPPCAGLGARVGASAARSDHLLGCAPPPEGLPDGRRRLGGTREHETLLERRRAVAA